MCLCVVCNGGWLALCCTGLCVLSVALLLHYRLYNCTLQWQVRFCGCLLSALEPRSTAIPLHTASCFVPVSETLLYPSLRTVFA